MSLFRPLLAGLGLAAMVAALPARVAAQTAPIAPLDLGTLGGRVSWSSGVSDTGVVAGCSWLETDFQCNPFGWTATAGMTPLAPAAGFGIVNGVSPSGLVVGYAHASSSDEARILVWNAASGFVDLGPGTASGVSANDLVFGLTDQGAFAWTAQDGLTPIPSLGGQYSVPEAASPNGMVVGFSYLPGNTTWHAFAWTRSGGIVDAFPGPRNSVAIGASNDGYVAGNVDGRAFIRAPNGAFFMLPGQGDGIEVMATHFSANGVMIGTFNGRAYAWTRTSYLVPLTLGGTSSHASAVSNTGIVIGWSDLPGDSARHAFLWTEGGGIVDLGGTNSAARAVNDHGLVAGLDDGRPFAWTEATGMLPLGTLGGDSVNIAAVSNTGLIAGDSETATTPSELHAVLWKFGYAFSGFFQPVDSAPTVNMVKAGSAVPLKFSLGGDLGLNILAPNSPASLPVSCSTSSPIDELEETVSAGGSSLTYDAVAGHYVYVWKTSSAWKNTCRQLTLRLADGSEHSAIFKFK